MDYPTMQQVEGADREQICRWYRFLDYPGKAFVGTPEFEAKLKEEKEIIDRISKRYKQLGGFTPEISKRIGWTPPA